MKTRITFGFKSKTQMPLFMVIKEYYDDDGNIEFAKVLFQIKGRKMRKLEKMLKTPIKTSRNCLEGYLTEQCANCKYWKNDADACGCGCPFPIMECEHFAKMYNEREGTQNV